MVRRGSNTHRTSQKYTSVTSLPSKWKGTGETERRVSRKSTMLITQGRQNVHHVFNKNLLHRSRCLLEAGRAQIRRAVDANSDSGPGELKKGEIRVRWVEDMNKAERRHERARPSQSSRSARNSIEKLKKVLQYSAVKWCGTRGGGVKKVRAAAPPAAAVSCDTRAPATSP